MKKNSKFLILISFVSVVSLAFAQKNTEKSVSNVWVSDKGDGTYQNPILHADYSDPDIIRVGKEYYMTASSMNQVPGLPILHSKDLVNWELINYAIHEQLPVERFNKVVHGGGAWAPAIRYHKGEYYIYYPDPDEGIWMVKAKNPAGKWSQPFMVKKVKGWIDPCPLWDEDGNAYLINGLAGSRSGMKSTLILSKMSPDGTKLLDDGVIVFDGHEKHPTIEGPKLYKLNGYYYILAPAGGVGPGWQVAMRSKNIYGPYEDKVVLERGSTGINGPHQGALVDTPTGESWFIHFQDKDAYGRILHLQPVRWDKNWPIMGVDYDGNGIGEPVSSWKKPHVGKGTSIVTPPESDEFNSNSLGLQWQWPANRQSNFAFSAGTSYGFLRLYNVPVPAEAKNLWDVPNLLTQKFPAPDFSVVTKCTFTARTEDEKTGLLIMGSDYAYISIVKTGMGYQICQASCIDAEAGTPEMVNEMIPINTNTLYFKVEVKNLSPDQPEYKAYNTAVESVYGNALCTFSYSTDGVHFNRAGKSFAARKAKWIGARVGLFAVRKGTTYETGYADFDWFRVTR